MLKNSVLGPSIHVPPISTISAVPKSPLASHETVVVQIPSLFLSEQDIDNLGKDLARQVGETTEKIISKMGVGKFDELGEILTSIQVEATKLDPASIQKGGVVGWFQRTFGDVKKNLTLHLRSAETVFEKLEEKISDHIAVHSEWIKDLDLLYQENLERYSLISRTIEKGQEWEKQANQAITSWPLIEETDPHAAMKAQNLRDAQSRLNRLRNKIDNFSRLKFVIESNAPKIKSQQETSRMTIEALRDVVDHTIPMIKMEFTLFLQSLDSKKTTELVESVRQLNDKTLKTSATSAKNAAVEAAKSLNTPMVATDTINHIRSKMLETISEVRRVETDAQTQRQADAKTLIDGQKEYLKILQSENAI